MCCGSNKNQGVQRRMVLVVNFFVFLKLFLFFLHFLLRVLLHLTSCTMCRLYMAYVHLYNNIWKSILKLQFNGHHSYFRKDCQMLLAVKEDENRHNIMH